jgi:hypothetical protein
MATINIKRLLWCTAIVVIPAAGFAKQQSLDALARNRTYNAGVYSCVDTIPAAQQKEEPLPDQHQMPVVKKVPKSRRQVKPLALPRGPVTPVIKPKIIKPAIKVSVL